MVTPQDLPGTKHKVICLISGGKDSCFNLMHVVANGHEVVATATLTPAPGIDELDSHMYQSVGTTMPPLIAESLSLPHYSSIIRGKAIEQGAEYGARERTNKEDSGRKGDETEDLTVLLEMVMKAHPEATAVASGAILSNYQRLRIEHVCARLKLVSLAYLWQQPQLSLVTSMIESGLEVVLVKVAGVGLGVKHVGQSLARLFPLLARLQAQYGAHPAGEGGEYESLTLDTPLSSHRLRIQRAETVVTDPEPYPVAYLRIEAADLDPKEGWTKPSLGELRELLHLDESTHSGAAGLDEAGLELLGAIGEVPVQPRVPVVSAPGLAGGVAEVHFGRQGRWFAASSTGCARPNETIGQELERCLDGIQARLQEQKLSLSLHAAHITLLLSGMSDFPAANAAYINYFGISPPSRACVAVPLPGNQRVRVEVVGFDDLSTEAGGPFVGGRAALHVQSFSYWAPANIGPYSQAVAVGTFALLEMLSRQVNGRLHIAGQIPLLPASLTLPCPPAQPASPYPHQAALALQHVRRIIAALRDPASTGGGWNGWGEGCVAWWTEPDATSGGEAFETVNKAWGLWSVENGWEGVPVVFVRASELPRGALVEYQTNMNTGRQGCDDMVSDADQEVDESELEGEYASGDVRGTYWETCRAPAGRTGNRAAIFIPDVDAISSLPAIHGISALLSRAIAIRAYHLPSVQPLIETLLGSAAKPSGCLTNIPVHEVRNRKGDKFGLALEVFA